MTSDAGAPPAHADAIVPESLEARDDDAIARFAAEQGVTPEQVRWMIGKFGSRRPRLILEARKLLDLE